MRKKVSYAEQKRVKEEKKLNIEGNFIVFRDKIIKVQEESMLFYVGFDIFSETAYRIKKNSEAIVMPDALIKILSCEKSRIKLADAMCNTRYDVCKLLNISERTAYRMYVNHGLHESERLLMTPKSKLEAKNLKIKNNSHGKKVSKKK